MSHAQRGVIARRTNSVKRLAGGVAVVLGLVVVAPNVQAQSATGTTFDIYGFVMADMIFEFGQSNPEWFDALRPSKLPAFDDEFGQNGRFYAGIRQSRIGTKATFPTGLGDLKTIWEFDLYGVGPDAGQTTIRPRHMWGEIGQFGAGQTDSPFMDGDVFPNILDYWGPNGMLYYRQPQVRWMPMRPNAGNKNSKMSIALERPGASGDQGRLVDRIELDNVIARFPLPDLSAEYRMGTNWGYVEASGIVRSIRLDDQLEDDFDLSKGLVGWGFSLSSNWKASAGNVVRFQAVYGEGIENYFNDAPVDVAPTVNTGDPRRPIVARTVPVFGITAYLDHNWNKWLSTAIGYSRVDITNTSLQTDLAFRDGQYATINLLATPAKNVMMGGEIQWARRHNFRDGFSFNDPKLQFGFKYNFGVKFENGTVAQR